MTFIRPPTPVELRSSFTQADLCGVSTDEKERERRRVTAWILRIRQERSRVFSLPGANWEWERQLDNATGNEWQFHGIDRLWESLELGSRRMPGDGLRRVRRETGYGAADGFETTRSKAYWLELGAIFDTLRQDRSKRSRHEWKAQFESWTAVWLDMQSPVTSKLVRALRRLPARLPMRCRNPVPVVVTCMKARETGALAQIFSAGGSRARLMTEAMEFGANRGRWGWRALLKDEWSYKGLGGVPMMSAVWELQP